MQNRTFGPCLEVIRRNPCSNNVPTMREGTYYLPFRVFCFLSLHSFPVALTTWSFAFQHRKVRPPFLDTCKHAPSGNGFASLNLFMFKCCHRVKQQAAPQPKLLVTLPASSAAAGKRSLVEHSLMDPTFQT
jgi:hypothetical protein